MTKIIVSFIIEILGKPKEHITEALSMMVEKIGKEDGIKLLKKTLHEPKPVENTETLFTTFAEVEVEVESLSRLFWMVFMYMPSHIEILSPEKITLTNVDMSELFSALSQKLHDYDSVAKKVVFERDELVKKLYEVAPHLFSKATQQEKAALAPIESPSTKNEKKSPVKKKSAKKNN